MRIGFIGAGRVGFTMGKYLKEHGVIISGYYSRTPEHAREAADFTDTVFYENVRELILNSDAVMLTVSDIAIKPVFEEIKDMEELAGKIVCHTSGAMSSQIFNDTDSQVFGYSIHPIYAISDRYESYKNFQNAFITIEGNEKYMEDIVSLFKNAGLNVGTMSSQNKMKYHAASVVASNLVCGMYNTAIKLLIECGFEPEIAGSALKNLFRDNAIGASENGPVSQLTGPLERNDTVTVEGHLETLKNTSEEDVFRLYVEASKQVLEIAKKKHPDTDYTKMHKLLFEYE